MRADLQWAFVRIIFLLLLGAYIMFSNEHRNNLVQDYRLLKYINLMTIVLASLAHICFQSLEIKNATDN